MTLARRAGHRLARWIGFTARVRGSSALPLAPGIVCSIQLLRTTLQPPAKAGHEPGTGLYWELLGDDGDPPPWLLIHGGGATGACFRTTLDGRIGWADLLAARGVPCWVTDWPGTGRSGGRDPLALRYEDLVAGYEALLRDVIGRPVLVLCHSMGGAITWPLVERLRDLVVGVVAVAASYPGNIQPASELVSREEGAMRVVFPASGVEFTVRTDRLYHYSEDYLLRQGIAGSTRFAHERLDDFRATLVGISPVVLLQRLGFEGGMPRIERTERFANLPVLLVFGSEDPAHTPTIEGRTAELLASWGARPRLVSLAERGLAGNGHFIYAEDNSAEILELVLALTREHAGLRSC